GIHATRLRNFLPPTPSDPNHAANPVLWLLVHYEDVLLTWRHSVPLRIILSMNRLPTEDRARILRALCEGCSLRSTSRMGGVSINTVTKLLIDAGRVCARFQHDTLRNLSCKRLQLDEVWGFVYAKERNVPTVTSPQ